MLKELTKQYIEAFNNKNLENCLDIFANDCVLKDPIVKKINGKEKVLQVIKNIFDSCNTLSFEAKNIYQDNQTTIIEFILRLDDSVLEGVDIIEWENGKIKELRAYLDIPCGDS